MTTKEKPDILYALDFTHVSGSYEDSEKRNVCGCCGSYYVVLPNELEDIQKTVKEMYEALKVIHNDSAFPYLRQQTRESVHKALNKAEGK